VYSVRNRPSPASGQPSPAPLWSTESVDAVIGWTLVRAYHLRAPQFVQVLQEVDLSPTQFGVLVQLDVETQLSQAELARRALMTPQSMGEVLTSLERLGHVQRGPRTGRGHPIPVSLTPGGREALARATPLVRAGNTAQSFGLTAEEAEILNLLLHKVVRHGAGH
jgi:DNA-binding MarR family transcriptional regulator